MYKGPHSSIPCCQGLAVLYFTHLTDEETEAEKKKLNDLSKVIQ